MSKPVQQKEADAVDTLLLTVAAEEDRYATAEVDRYATAEVDRYATAEVDRYATAKPDRYATTKPDRYSHTEAAWDSIRYALTGEVNSRKRILKTTIVLMEPPTGFKGDMLYLPSSEFERAYDFEYSNWMDLWQVGHVLNFTEAAEAAWESQGVYAGDGEPWLLAAAAVDGLSSMFHSQSEIWGEHESDLWDDALAVARRIREELVADPDLVLDCLEDYPWAGVIGGSYPKHRSLDRAEVLAALRRSTSRGVGAAAIDLIVWNGSDLIPEWRELNDLVDLIKETDFVPDGPLENLVFDSAELHPRTQRVESGAGIWYDLFGEYVVAGTEYHSDLCRSQPYGWRNCRMVPHGTPVFPEFAGGAELPKYPHAFIDRAQGALFPEE